MVISLTNGKKVLSFLSETSVQRAVEKTKVWAKNYVPPSKPIDLNKARRTEAIAKNPDAVPLCHQYWAKLQEEGALKRPYPYRTVDYHGRFNTFNDVLIKGKAGIWDMQTVVFCDEQGRTVKEVVTEADIHFKRLRPTKEPVTVYRVVGEKTCEGDMKYYNRAFNAKKGDVITMPEYAYFAGGRQYSDVYMGNEGRGIIYEMEVPAGARVSHSGDIVNGKLDDWGAELVTPRGSQMEVLEAKLLEDGSKYFKLRYILPKEPWRAQ